MKILQLCIIALMAMTVQSCLEPDPITEDEMLIEQESVAENPVNNDAPAEPSITPGDLGIAPTYSEITPADQAIVTLEGLWISESITTSGTIITTNNGVNPSTETMTFQGIAYDIDHSVNFVNVPNIAIGEGIYSLSVEMTDQATSELTTQEIQGLTLISSQTYWTREGDQLTFDSGGKIRTATILELTEDRLILYFEENTEVTSQGGTMVENIVKNTTYEFVK